MTDFNVAVRDPGACFSTPEEVLREDWTLHQKYQVLRQWQYDIGQLHVATEENMPARSAAMSRVQLGEVHRAIEALDYSVKDASNITKGD